MVLSYEIDAWDNTSRNVTRIPCILLLASMPVVAGLPRVDSELQVQLRQSLDRMGLDPLVAGGKLAVSLLDLSDPAEERYASFNDRLMMYAASLPKLGVLLGAFQAICDGLLPHTPAVEASLTRMIRQSSNGDASALIQRLGYDFIARTLASDRYRLYDPAAEGGVWVGKSYGPSGVRRHVEFWRPEPISGEWHAANSLQVARFFWLLSRGDLVGEKYCRSMKRMLSKPDANDYFVEGLRLVGVREMYRKSGTFGDTHCDAVLVEHKHKRYVAVAMVSDPGGPRILSRLIQELHRLVI
jgi:beta-lactamase class A